MFAVKGWAVSADNLKTETEKSNQAPPSAEQQQQQEQPNKSKKRKRQSAPTPSNVTAANVADLWEQVIERKSGKKAKTDGGAAAAAGKGSEKQQHRNGHVKKDKAGNGDRNDGDDGDDDGHDNDGAEIDAVPKLSRKERKKANKEKAKLEKPGDGDVGRTQSNEPPAKKSKKDKKNKRAPDVHHDDKNDEGREHDGNTQQDEQQQQEPAAPVPAPPKPKLTPLQAAMREKLISARFRHLNETLYTRPSAEAFALFRESPEMFREYHEGFRRQVGVWPENPVDGYVAEIQRRGAKRDHRSHGHKSKHGGPPPPPASNAGDGDDDGGVQPLPRGGSGGTCTIADLGCGDGKLALALRPSLKKLRLEVLSYDLQSGGATGGSHVTQADIADLPRPDASVDVAVFCLALMGTNWPDFIEEAYRVLRWRGELWVAEIKSRFASSSSSPSKSSTAKKPVTHSVGFRKKGAAAAKGGKGKGKKGDDDEDDEDHAEDLAVEVDGAEDRRGGTDVSAFVEALRRRGFVLQGQPDLRNRMFVRMRFLKAAPAAVGKCASASASGAQGQGQGQGQARGRQSLAQRRDAIKKFIEDDDNEEAARADESAILKPCVYKIR